MTYELLTMDPQLEQRLLALASAARAAAFAPAISSETTAFQRAYRQTISLAAQIMPELKDDLAAAFDRWAEIPKFRRRQWGLPEQNIWKFSMFLRYLRGERFAIERPFWLKAASDKGIDGNGLTNTEICLRLEALPQAASA